MYKTNGRRHYQRIHGQDLADGQTVPQNDTWTGAAVKLSGTLGAVEVVARVHTALAIADAAAITIKLRHAGADLSYSDLATLYTLTAAGGNGAIAADTELGRFVLPSNVKENVLATITTTDAAATGKVDIIPTYLPR